MLIWMSAGRARALPRRVPRVVPWRMPLAQVATLRSQGGPLCIQSSCRLRGTVPESKADPRYAWAGELPSGRTSVELIVCKPPPDVLASISALHAVLWGDSCCTTRRWGESWITVLRPAGEEDTVALHRGSTQRERYWITGSCLSVPTKG